MIINLMVLKYDHKLTEKNAVAYKKSIADFYKKSVVMSHERRKMVKNINRKCAISYNINVKVMRK